jgi:hypothetical protein
LRGARCEVRGEGCEYHTEGNAGSGNGVAGDVGMMVMEMVERVGLVNWV